MPSRLHWLIALDGLLLLLALVAFVDVQNAAGNHWRFFGGAADRFVAGPAAGLVVSIGAINAVAAAMCVVQRKYALAAAISVAGVVVVAVLFFVLRLVAD
ncbi:hypothetical protein WMF30_15275 [Sorangium sp. So ce134]